MTTTLGNCSNKKLKNALSGSLQEPVLSSTAHARSCTQDCQGNAAWPPTVQGAVATDPFEVSHGKACLVRCSPL